MSRMWGRFRLCCTATLLLALAAAPARAQPADTDARYQAWAQSQVRDATLRLYVALNSVLHGDLEPVKAVWSHAPDVTDLDSSGGRAKGWNEVFEKYRNTMRLNLGGRIAPQDIVVVAGRGMGYSVCTEVGQTRTPEGPLKSYSKRATNVFRLEDGKWKLIHRHADPVQVLEP